MPPKRSPQKYVRPHERDRDKGILGKRTMFEVFIVLLGRVLNRLGRSSAMTRYQPCKYMPTRSPKKWTYRRKSGNFLHVGSESPRGFPFHLLKDFAKVRGVTKAQFESTLFDTLACIAKVAFGFNNETLLDDEGGWLSYKKL